MSKTELLLYTDMIVGRRLIDKYNTIDWLLSSITGIDKVTGNVFKLNQKLIDNTRRNMKSVKQDLASKRKEFEATHHLYLRMAESVYLDAWDLFQSYIDSSEDKRNSEFGML